MITIGMCLYIIYTNHIVAKVHRYSMLITLSVSRTTLITLTMAGCSSLQTTYWIDVEIMDNISLIASVWLHTVCQVSNVQ